MTKEMTIKTINPANEEIIQDYDVISEEQIKGKSKKRKKCLQ